MSKLLIVIPAHNEEANIVQVVEELTTDYPQYDYVVVNDGSRDKTAAICRARGYRLIDLRSIWGWRGRSRPACALRRRTATTALCRWTLTASTSRSISRQCSMSLSRAAILSSAAAF